MQGPDRIIETIGTENEISKEVTGSQFKLASFNFTGDYAAIVIIPSASSGNWQISFQIKVTFTDDEFITERTFDQDSDNLTVQILLIPGLIYRFRHDSGIDVNVRLTG